MNPNYLLFAGAMSFLASLTHLAIIAGGASWYRFFGAGERMATMAEQGLWQPALTTLCVASVLAVWGAYAWSGAGVLPKLPLLKLALILITLVYCLRGLLGLIAPFVTDHPQIAQNSVTFWVCSSIICLLIGLVHLMGVLQNWSLWVKA